MFKKGNCLSVSIDSNINLSATQLHPIHHPAGALCHLGRLKLNHTAPLGLPILHLDVGVQHVAWVGTGRERDHNASAPPAQPARLHSVQITCWILVQSHGGTRDSMAGRQLWGRGLNTVAMFLPAIRPARRCPEKGRLANGSFYLIKARDSWGQANQSNTVRYMEPALLQQKTGKNDPSA